MGSATYALIPLLIAIQLLASCSKDTSDASKSKALEPRQPPQLTKDIDWYAPHAISETCTITEGPGEMIKTVKAAGVYYSTTDEIRSGDVLVQVTLVIPSAGTPANLTILSRTYAMESANGTLSIIPLAKPEVQRSVLISPM